MFEPLKTLKGSKIWYSKYGVGKRVGSKIYFHKSVWDRIVPEDVWKKANNMLMVNCLSPGLFNTVCYDINQTHVVRFDICEGFDTEREPVVGQMVFVNTETRAIWNKYNQQVYHHKWLFCNEDYDGFDVRESYEWSKTWLEKLPEVASGYQHKWEEQLKKYNII